MSGSEKSPGGAPRPTPKLIFRRLSGNFPATERTPLPSHFPLHPAAAGAPAWATGEAPGSVPPHDPVTRPAPARGDQAGAGPTRDELKKRILDRLDRSGRKSRDAILAWRKSDDETPSLMNALKDLVEEGVVLQERGQSDNVRMSEIMHYEKSIVAMVFQQRALPLRKLFGSLTASQLHHLSVNRLLPSQPMSKHDVYSLAKTHSKPPGQGPATSRLVQAAKAKSIAKAKAKPKVPPADPTKPRTAVVPPSPGLSNLGLQPARKRKAWNIPRGDQTPPRASWTPPSPEAARPVSPGPPRKKPATEDRGPAPLALGPASGPSFQEWQRPGPGGGGAGAGAGGAHGASRELSQLL